jgi:hypothetical protein
MRNVTLIAFLAFLVACSTNRTDQLPENITACPEERPQICSMIYAPVCALTNDGSRKTFTSDCVACGDDAVIGFEKGGPCEE